MYQSYRMRTVSGHLVPRDQWVNSSRISAQEFLERYHKLVKDSWQAGPLDMARVYGQLFRWVTDDRVLLHAWDHLAKKGGLAPGSNGLTYLDYPRSDYLRMIRHLKMRMRSFYYYLGPLREVPIPKASGRGTRVLKLSNIEDRVVERAIALILQIVAECFFLPTSFAFRPKLSTWHALLQAEKQATSQNRYVWITQDIKNAFDRVPLKRLRDLVRLYFPNDQLIELIEQVLLIRRRQPANANRRGIRQGGSLSPLLLNVYLHHHLDLPWRQQFPQTLLLRYADDLLVLCSSMREAEEKFSDLNRMLIPRGMLVKHGKRTAICHLSGHGQAEWLGFIIRHSSTGDWSYEVADASYDDLAMKLEKCHRSPWAFERAKHILHGWLDSMGPVFNSQETIDDCVERLFPIMQHAAIDEVLPISRLREMCSQAHDNWQLFKKSA